MARCFANPLRARWIGGGEMTPTQIKRRYRAAAKLFRNASGIKKYYVGDHLIRFSSMYFRATGRYLKLEKSK